MKLKSLKIKSYRSCLKTHLEVQKGLTTLIGVNGTGKSNILNAILLLKKIRNISNHFSYRDEDSLVNKGSFEVEIEYKSKPVFIKAKMFYNTDESNNDELVNCETTWDFSQLLDIQPAINIPPEMFRLQRFMIGTDIKRLPKNIFRFRGLKIDTKQIENISLIYPHVDSILRGLSKISYYSASQFSDPSLCPNFIEIEEDRPVRRSRLDTRHEKFITDLYRSFKEKSQSKFDLYVNTIGKFGINLVDDIKFKEVPIPSNSYKVMSGGQIKTYSKNRTLIVPSFEIDNNPLSPSQLSEGTFRTLALIYYLLTDENDILLMEEPEIGVHHGLLSSIISLIKSQSKNKQIIISTHSDFVLDQLNPEELILVEKIVNKGTTAKALSKRLTKQEYKNLKMYLRETGNLGDYWKESGF